VAVALANKTARIAWAVMHRQENYQRMAAARSDRPAPAAWDRCNGAASSDRRETVPSFGADARGCHVSGHN
jgi:hypothetical protein